VASLVKTGKRSWRILFRYRGSQKSFRFQGSDRSAKTILAHTENILEARTSNIPLDSASKAWLEEIDEKLYGKLERVGLVVSRTRTTTKKLCDLTTFFLEQADVAEGTKQVYRQAIRSLHDFFGEQKPISEITTMDAQAWRTDLTKKRYANATQYKRINTVKTIFNRAVDWELVGASPFRHLKSGSQENPDRQEYVPVDVINAVLKVRPDDEWRCLICLARFAGLRCPSEISLLRWEHVDLQARRMTVLSRKTKRYKGGDRREVPIVPQLFDVLSALHRARTSTSGPVVPRLAGRSNINLRTQFEKFIRRAGQEQWEKLFQNLRVSAENDFQKTCRPAAVRKWMGHSAQVAARHYEMVLDSDFDDAIRVDPEDNSGRS